MNIKDYGGTADEKKMKSTHSEVERDRVIVREDVVSGRRTGDSADIF